MRKTTKIIVSIILVLLMAGSGTLLVVALTRPSAAYDPEKVNLDIKVHTREQILTCAYKIYGDDTQNYWAAKTIIKNNGEVPVYDFKIAYKVGDYTDWTSDEEYPVIVPGETVRDYCWPVLDGEEVQDITTATPVSLKMRYSYKGKEPTELDERITLLGKNDFIFTSLAEEEQLTFADAFDNYNFIPAFITPNEETTKSFANRVAGGLETRMNDQDVLEAFLRCFDALREHGVKYIQEPPGFWAGTEAQYIQYPKETLDRKSGTCIDLAIAMSALMEAVGIRSYVALIPGHAIPIIQCPVSGETYAIESTFIDKDYALSHFPDVTSPEVTAEECISLAMDTLDQSAYDGMLILIDPEYWWEHGVMPSE